MIQRTFGHALSALVAAALSSATGAALAQQSPSNSPPAAAQSAPAGDARELLGRARSANDGQMVEDLIRRLQMPGDKGTPAGPAATPPAASAPPASPGATPRTTPPPRVAAPPPRTAPPATPPSAGRTPDTPATTPVAAEPPATAPPTQAQRRPMPRPMGETLASKRERAPMQAPIPETISAPTPPSEPARRAAPPPSSTVAAPPATEQPTIPQLRSPPPPRRAATEPPATPPPAVAVPSPPSQRVLRQAPLTPAQVERMDALPNINVEVLFFIDSANLTNRAFATLAVLGRALADERLANQVFLIAGHTDASGAHDYNVALSERRAEAVREFLIQNFAIKPERLLARGFGPEKLRNPANPYSRLNRRVQVVNWTSEADPAAGQPIPPPRQR